MVPQVTNSIRFKTMVLPDWQICRWIIMVIGLDMRFLNQAYRGGKNMPDAIPADVLSLLDQRLSHELLKTITVGQSTYYTSCRPAKTRAA
jgi:hypothetical protein